ncbi:MAG: branched-chain amino acid aminotransferase [Planctomycetota bacterium]
MTYEFTVDQVPDARLKPLFTDTKTLGFGTKFTDHMFTAKFSDGQWHDLRIGPYQNFSFDPATMVFHYGQEIFEGMKAYVGPNDGSIRLFRPDRNCWRMNNSAKRMCMPQIPDDLMEQAISDLVLLDQRWIPQDPGTALYIRPAMIGTAPMLGVKASSSYLFFIILSPVGPYFSGGFAPVPLYVSKKYVRAVAGGVGEAKTGGNYAASLLAGEEARKKGCSQVLWLDGKEHRYVEEVGAMNIFFVFEGKKLVTPALNGSILPGVTRASVVELSRHLGYECEERAIAIDEVLDGARSGKLTEAFGAGTAAVIAPVGKFVTDAESLEVGGNQVGPVARQMYDQLTGIQLGTVEDTFGWVKIIGQLAPTANA